MESLDSTAPAIELPALPIDALHLLGTKLLAKSRLMFVCRFSKPEISLSDIRLVAARVVFLNPFAI